MYSGFRVVALFLTMKVLLEWELITIQRGENPSKIVYWFTLFWSGPQKPDDAQT